MKKPLSLLVFTFLTIGITSCDKGDYDHDENTYNKFVKSYIAGKLNPIDSERYSPFLINFEDDSLAHFVSSTKEFHGKYIFQADTLTFQSDNREKVAVFAIEDDKITYSHYEVRFYNEDGSYEPAPVKYETSAELELIPKSNQLAGKTYLGDQFKFGVQGVFQKDFTFKFADSGNTYGSGTENINENTNRYKSFNNIAFRFENEGTKEFGVLINGQLVTFKENGLFYWGTYDLQ